MLTKNEMHALVEQWPEHELELLSRVMEGLKATTPLKPVVKRRKIGDPLVPPEAISPANIYAPLAQEYSQAVMTENEPEDNRLLRKVMFTPLQDLLSWVNQPAASSHLSR